MVTARRRAVGFTLIEVLVVVAIMGVVLAIGVPGVQSLLNTQKMKSATFDLVTTTMFARSEAIKWGGASSSSISIAAPSNNFNSGWCIVFTSSTACSLSAPGDGVMQVIKATSGVTYTYQGTAAPITFTRTGRLSGGTSVKFLVADTDPHPVPPRCVTIDTTGNATVRVLASGTTSC
jgi:type IV fimbrial biogenesis protein FimT